MSMTLNLYFFYCLCLLIIVGFGILYLLNKLIKNRHAIIKFIINIPFVLYRKLFDRTNRIIWIYSVVLSGITTYISVIVPKYVYYVPQYHKLMQIAYIYLFIVYFFFFFMQSVCRQIYASLAKDKGIRIKWIEYVGLLWFPLCYVLVNYIIVLYSVSIKIYNDYQVFYFFIFEIFLYFLIIRVTVTKFNKLAISFNS